MGLFSSISDSLSDALGGSSFLGVDLGGAVGDVLGGLGTTLANSAGSIISSYGQYLTNKKNLANQDYWNKVAVELANTAHQRQRADLEAAGINPILAANQGSTTPSLSSATMQNPLASFGTNSKSIADAINGQTRADLKLAEADASTAEAYAKQADHLASAQREQAEVDLELSRLDADARKDAIEGTFSPQHFQGKDGVYSDLVEQYRNEIKSGRYKSSLGHAIYDDVRSGVSSASDLVGVIKGVHGMLPKKPQRPQVERESHIINRYNAKGEMVGSERRTRQRSRTR